MLKTSFFFALILSVFLAYDAHAAVAVDNATSANTGSATATSLTWSHSVSGADRILLVGVSINGNTTVSSVTYGGVQLIRIATVAQGTAARASLWYLLNPAQGTNTVTVTMAGSARFVAGAHSYTGVDQDNPIGTPVINNAGSGTSATISVSSASDELVADVVARRGDLTSNPLTVGAGQTQRWNNRSTINNINSGVTGGGSSKQGASTTTMSWTWPSSRAWAIAAVSLKPTSSPGDTTPPLRFNGLPSGTLPDGTTETTLSVQTDENATCRYDSAAGTGYSSMANTFQTTGGVSHSQPISGLSDGVTYEYYIKCLDTFGNSNGDDFLVSFAVDSAPPPPPPDIEPPSIPANVSADPVTSTQITVSWDASSDNVAVVGYNVFRDSILITATSDIFYFATGLIESTAYSYTISAFDEAGNESAQSTSADATTLDPPPPPPPDPDAEPPTVPGNVSAAAISESEIAVSWDASSDNEAVAGYNVFRDGSLAATVGDTQYTDIGLQESTSYSYAVSAFDTSGNESEQSTAVQAQTFSAPPPPADTEPPLRFNGFPSGVLPAGTTETTLALQTDENATCKYDTSAGTGYSSMPNTFGVTEGVSHSQSIASLAENIHYAYYVRCQDDSGNFNEDDFVIEFSIAPQIDNQAPSVPSGLTLESVSATGVRFHWSASTDNVGVEGYKIFRDGEQVGSTADTSYAGVGVVGLTTYSYNVSAFDAAGNESAQSNALVVTTPAVRTSGGSLAAADITTQPILSDAEEGTDTVIPSDEEESAIVEQAVSEEVSQSEEGGAPDTASDNEQIFTKSLFFGIADRQVVLLQFVLFRELSLSAEGRLTGYFGNFTKTAVQRFQCEKRIVCEGNETSTGYGRVGPKTRAALNEVVYMNSNLQVRLRNASPSVFLQGMSFGMRNEEVKRLQEILSEDMAVYPEALFTGYFGELTRKAVQRFQCAQQIVCEGNAASTGYGRVGPKTRAALNEIVFDHAG